jgi:hypothetical protein
MPNGGRTALLAAPFAMAANTANEAPTVAPAPLR